MVRLYVSMNWSWKTLAGSRVCFPSSQSHTAGVLIMLTLVSMQGRTFKLVAPI